MSIQPGLPMRRDMSADTMKMPDPTITPMTIMVESNRPRPRTNPRSSFPGAADGVLMWGGWAGQAGNPPRGSRFYFLPAGAVEKRYTVWLWNFCPGRRVVLGNEGLLGESGKCCVSRANPLRCAYTLPPLPLSVPSRKLPV